MPKLTDKIHIFSHQEYINNTLLKKLSQIELDVNSELYIKEVQSVYDIDNMILNEKKDNGNMLYEFLDGSIVIFLKSSNEIFFFVKDIRHIDAIRGLITIFTYLWLSYQNIMWLHASSFCFNGQNVLILGNSGSGKSTLTLMAHCNGAQIISEENTCICFNKYSSYIAINKHDIAIFDDEITTYSVNYSNGAYKTPHSKKNKTMIKAANLSFVGGMCSPNVIILLNDQKDALSYTAECSKYHAIKRIIKLHPCFNNYQSTEWLRMVISMITNIKIFEITPSYDKEKTYTEIIRILEVM